MGDSISKAFELEEEAKLKGMSDREIMDAKKATFQPNDDIATFQAYNNVVAHFEVE